MAKIPQAFNRQSAVLKAFATLGRNTVRCQEGFVLFQTVLGTSAQYNLDVTNNVQTNGPQLATENRIRQNDAFVPTKIGMAVRKAADTTAGSMAVAVQRYWPNPLVFTGANEAANLEAIWNSRIVTNANSVLVSEMQWSQPFRYVPMAQQGVQISQQAAAVGTNGAWLMDGKERPDVGMIPFEQDLALNGVSNQVISLVLPAAVNMAGTESVNILDIFFWGIYAINGAPLVKDKSLSVFIQEAANARKGAAHR
jgi:hypothetical protein